jgi:hypothetical protein
MLATLSRPPPRGSLQEAVLQALLIKKGQIEYLRTRAIVQAIVNHEEAESALLAYRSAALPYLERVEERTKKEHLARLLKEIDRGPLSVTPIMQPRVGSKLRARARGEISKKIGGYL